MTVALDAAAPSAMFRRFFNSCLQKRPERARSSPSPHLEGSAETDSSDATLVSLQSTTHSPRFPTRDPTAASAREKEEAQQRTPSSKSDTMPRAAKAKSTPKSAKDRKPSLRVQQASRYLAKKGQSNDDDSAANVQKAKAQLNGMFNELVPSDLLEGSSRKADDVGHIDIEGTMAYFQRLDANLEDIDAFVVLSTVQSDSLGITREGFVNGWARFVDMNAGNFQAATITWAWQKQFVRAHIHKALTDAAYFKELYNLAFEIAREPPQKAISMENAIAFWGALYNPTTNPWRSAHVDWLDAWTAYLREKFGTPTEGDWAYSRTVSKDLWNQTRLFALKAMEDETLGFWSEEQAWPGLIDEFVVWCREKGKVPAQNGEAMEVEE